jgi:hypothetical protein
MVSRSAGGKSGQPKFSSVTRSLFIMDTSQLTAKQIQALPLLASGVLATDVAQQLGVSPQQISAWRKDPAFMSAMGALRWEALCGAIGHLQILSRDATDCLGQLIRQSSDDRVRFAACKFVLEMAGLNWGREGFGWRIDPKDKTGI